MKKYALAALLALPLLTLAAQSASANDDCCTSTRPAPQERKYYVTRPATVFDRDDRNFNTHVRLRADTFVFARCYRSGWCQIEPRLYENAWVLAVNLELAEKPRRRDYPDYLGDREDRSDYRGSYRSGPDYDTRPRRPRRDDFWSK